MFSFTFIRRTKKQNKIENENKALTEGAYSSNEFAVVVLLAAISQDTTKILLRETRKRRLCGGREFSRGGDGNLLFISYTGGKFLSDGK